MSAPAAGAADKPARTGRRIGALLLAFVVVVALAAALRDRVPAGQSPAAAPDVPAVAAATPPDTARVAHRVVAYYFHTNYRCSSCRKIEAYTARAIETGFAQEIADGRLVWRVVNIEDEGNRHFAEDYRLYTKSVILSDERAGREVRWTNLARVWELLNDEAKFVAYVQTETQAYLDGVP